MLEDLKDRMYEDSTIKIVLALIFLVILIFLSIFLIYFGFTGFFTNHILLPIGGSHRNWSRYELFIGIPKNLLCTSILFGGFALLNSLTLIPATKVTSLADKVSELAKSRISLVTEFIVGIAFIVFTIALIWQMYSVPL